jgi:hypothetical protein
MPIWHPIAIVATKIGILFASQLCTIEKDGQRKDGNIIAFADHSIGPTKMHCNVAKYNVMRNMTQSLIDPLIITGPFSNVTMWSLGACRRDFGGLIHKPNTI